MNKLSNKIRNNEGFTLVEMLIVVAIIAILIAISIPLVDSALQRARHATDAANERAAKAAIILKNIGDATPIPNGYYDAKAGDIKAGGAGTTIVGYGQHGKGSPSHTGRVIQVSYTDDGAVCMKWVETTAVTIAATAVASNENLCSDVSVTH